MSDPLDIGDNLNELAPSDAGEGVIGPVQQSLTERLLGGDNDKYGRFVLAALSSVPGIGLLAALANLKGEDDQDQINQLVRLWLTEQQDRLRELGGDLQEVISRFESLGPSIDARLQSPAYLSLVRQTFRTWDQSDTAEKREMLKKLIANSAAISVSEDDLVRLFIKWIDEYHESHFLVIREIYKNPGISRGQIWDANFKSRPREDSAEADLFRYLIRDLSTGGVIRQRREVNFNGEFQRSTRPKQAKRTAPASTMESAFESSKEYVLTGLGEKFVHYVMRDVAPQLGSGI